MIHSCPHIGQHQVQYGQGCHAFYNHDCAGNDDRIVASRDLQRTFNMVTANGLLWLKDGWSWLDMSAQKDGRAVADAAQNTAGVVGFLGNLSILYAKGIVVFGAFAGRNLDSTAVTAPMDMIAEASLASSLSKTGSPIPAGRPVTQHSITPPEES